jgi:cytochrome P450/ferredoxin
MRRCFVFLDQEVSMVSTACPVVHDFDPIAADYLADPYPFLAGLRAEQQVFYAPGLDVYVVTRYADIDRILMDPETFSSANTVTPLWPVDKEAKAILARAFERVPTLSNADGPRHARMRRHVARSLSPRRIKMLWSAVEEEAARLLDRVLAADPADFYAEFAYPLPALTAFRLLGFPDSDTDLIKGWVTDRQMLTWGHATPQHQREIATNIVAFSGYIERFVADRIDEPRDDVVSELARVHREDPQELTFIDIANIVFLLSAGAHETTTNLITHGVRRLLENPDEWRRLCENQDLIPAAVEEVLRYDASAIGWSRITTVDTTIGGYPVPGGSRILMLLGSANRDGAKFPDAETFDIRRSNARQHLSFGKGIHFCLGAPLARMEADVALRLLCTRAPGLRLVEDQTFPYHPNAVMRSPQRLLVHTAPDATPHRPPADEATRLRPVETRARAGTMLPVEIDADACIGSGTCARNAPGAFALETTTASVLPGAGELDAADIDRAIAECPAGAILRRAHQ